MLTTAQENIIKETLAPFEPEYIGVFGSYTLGEQNDASDLDLLVRFGKQLNLFDLVGLEQDLTELLGVKVDLVTENALSPLIKEYLEKDLKKASRN